jgi:UDP-glucuronate decarboxylase
MAINTVIDLTQLEGKTVTITGSTGLIGTALLKSLEGIAAEIFTPTHKHLAVGYGIPLSDVIIHAAGFGQPSIFMRNPIDTIQVNTEMTLRLLKSLKAGGSFLFCSSSEVYNGLDKLATEDDIGTTTPAHPRACYIESKRCGEAIVNGYRQMGAKAFSARIAPTYGPGTRRHDTKAMSQFIASALVDKKIMLKDSGKAVRTYGYVNDVVEMLWNIVLNGTEPVYNVGGHSVVTIRELASHIAVLTGAEVCVPYDMPDQIGGSAVVKLDLSRYEKEFGKTDYVSLDEGLKKTIEYQRGLYDA